MTRVGRNCEWLGTVRALLSLINSQENTSAEAAPMNPKKGAVSWLDILLV